MPGRLSQVLVKAGVALLDEEGMEGLSLRRIAARAGVSHAAPAHHFDGLPGLRAAIAIQGFHDLRGDLEAVRDGFAADADPFQRLLGVNLAYICFARRRGALFRLMFDQIRSQNTDLRVTARTTYLILQQASAPLVGHRDPPRLESAVWALTHGFALLEMDRPYPSDSPIQVSSYEDALRLLVG